MCRPITQKDRKMTIEITQKEANFIKLELDYRLKKCSPLGYPTSNSQVLPKEHADLYNGLYHKITGSDHPDYIKYRETLT